MKFFQNAKMGDRNDSLIDKFRESMSQFSASECGQDEMMEVINGPFNQPSTEEIESGKFVSEYRECLAIFENEIEKSGLSVEELGMLGGADCSRCFPLYLGDKLSNVERSLPFIQRSLVAIKDLGSTYCASLALDWRIKDRTRYLYIGVFPDQIKLTSWID